MSANNIRGVTTNKTIICFIAMQTYKELKLTLFILIALAVLNCSPYRSSKDYLVSIHTLCATARLSDLEKCFLNLAMVMSDVAWA